MKILYKIQLAWYLRVLPCFGKERIKEVLTPYIQIHGIIFGEKSLFFWKIRSIRKRRTEPQQQRTALWQWTMPTSSTAVPGKVIP